MRAGVRLGEDAEGGDAAVGAVGQNPTLGSHPSHRRLYLRAEPVGQTGQQDGHSQNHARPEHRDRKLAIAIDQIRKSDPPHAASMPRSGTGARRSVYRRIS